MRNTESTVTILGIETSCDETAAAVYGDTGLQSHVVASQLEAHRAFGGVVPELASRMHIEAVSVVVDAALHEAGLSLRKAEYLLDLAQHFSAGSVHVKQWQQMSDDAIIEELVAIRGIGRWTAEMFLIFHLMRPNVLPLDDVGLINGISKNYFSGEPVSRSDAREVAQAWLPYSTVATWYIWRSLDPVPVEY